MYEFSFTELLNCYKQQRKWFYINAAIAFVLGVIIAFSIPKSYTSKVRLAAEAQREGMLGANVGALASLAGMDLGKSEDAIGLELYPDVVSTNKFLLEMLYAPVKTKKGTSYDSYLDYAKIEERDPWWTMGIKATIKGLKALLTGKKAVDVSLAALRKTNPYQLSLEEETLVKSMKGTIMCSVDKSSQVITITAITQDPLVSKMLADRARLNLQQFITNYRTSKARTDWEYYKSLEKQLYQRYLSSQRKYIAFADSHHDLALKSYTSKETDLENAMQFAYNAYTQVKQQVAAAEAKVQARTPAFTIIEDAYVPNRASSPKKLLLLIAFLFLAELSTAAWFYAKLLFSTSKGKA